MALDALIEFFETLTPDSVARLPEFYAPTAHFKDPFNDVRGCVAIQRIFSHMFHQVDEPRFVVRERVQGAAGALLVWELSFALRTGGRARPLVIRGASHLKFGADGKVCLHRDYWDTGEELYQKLPVLGLLMRALRRKLAA